MEEFDFSAEQLARVAVGSDRNAALLALVPQLRRHQATRGYDLPLDPFTIDTEFYLDGEFTVRLAGRLVMLAQFMPNGGGNYLGGGLLVKRWAGRGWEALAFKAREYPEAIPETAAGVRKKLIGLIRSRAQR